MSAGYIIKARCRFTSQEDSGYTEMYAGPNVFTGMPCWNRSLCGAEVFSTEQEAMSYLNNKSIKQGLFYSDIEVRPSSVGIYRITETLERRVETT